MPPARDQALLTRRQGKTKSMLMSLLDFIAIAQGDKIRFEGSKVGGGRRLFFAEAHGQDEGGHVAASAKGICRDIYFLKFR